jgi:hypothetical protein
MKRTPVYVTVREDHTTVIESHPAGFPVDGDALHDSAEKRKRAENRIAADQDLLAAARTWLGSPLHPSDPPLTAAQVAQRISTLFAGGAPRFVAVAPSLQKVQAAS